MTVISLYNLKGRICQMRRRIQTRRHYNADSVILCLITDRRCDMQTFSRFFQCQNRLYFHRNQFFRTICHTRIWINTHLTLSLQFLSHTGRNHHFVTDLNYRAECIFLHTVNLSFHAFRCDCLFSRVLNINIFISHISGIFIESQIFIRSSSFLIQNLVGTVLIDRNFQVFIFQNALIRKICRGFLVLIRLCLLQIICCISHRRNFCLKRYQHLLCHIWLTEPVIRQIVPEGNSCIFDFCRNCISVCIAKHQIWHFYRLRRLITIPYKQIVIAEQMQFFCNDLFFRGARSIPYNERNLFAVSRKCRGIHLIGQIFYTLIVNRIRHLSALRKAGFHFFIYFIDAAAADAVMRMILHQLFPAVNHLVFRVCFAKHLCHGCRRVCFPLQCCFAGTVVHFQSHPGRSGVCQGPSSVCFLAFQLALYRREILGNFFFHCLYIGFEIRMNKFNVRV